MPGAGGEAAAFPLSVHLMGKAKANHAMATRVLLAFEACGLGAARPYGPRPAGCAAPGTSDAPPPAPRPSEEAEALLADVLYTPRFLSHAQLRDAQRVWSGRDHSDTLAGRIRVPTALPT